MPAFCTFIVTGRLLNANCQSHTDRKQHRPDGNKNDSQPIGHGDKGRDKYERYKEYRNQIPDKRFQRQQSFVGRLLLF